MVGILNNKERILDTILTLEGRRQIVGGNFQIKFAAFSDRYTFYEGDVVSGSANENDRIFFETTSLPSDQITFEADDSGLLVKNKPIGNLRISNGKIIQSGSFVTGSQFASLASNLLTSSIDNFRNLQIIGSNDFFREDEQFVISQNSINFYFNDEKPISSNEIQSISIDKIESFIQDKRMSHLPNFKFLPPVNKKTNNNSISVLGQFRKINQPEILLYDDLMDDLKGRDFHTIEFSETSRLNNIFAQFFEVNKNSLKKLDVIDFGIFHNSDGTEPHVFFVGKVFMDDFDSHTFVNLFTLVFI